jgi:hypothetical protein
MQWVQRASPRVTWTFLRETRVTTLVGDSCAMWARWLKRLEVRKSRVGEGSECESLQIETPKPELPKRKLNVVGPDDVAEGNMDPSKCPTCHHLNR